MQQTKPVWAERVDQILQTKERSRSWLARRLGIERSQLTRLMDGKPTGGGFFYSLSQERQKRIAEILEVPVGMIFGLPES